MSDSDSQIQLLVKTKPGAPAAALQFQKVSLRFTAEPLFNSIGVPRGAIAAAPTATWQILKPIVDGEGAGLAEIANPWDLCHQLLESGLGVAGGDQVEFAEPDLQQQWLVGRPGAIAAALATAPDHPDNQNPNYPTLPSNFWYRDPQHGQWDAALAASPDPGDRNRSRVAHLDTGYDPNHLTRPKYLNKTLQKNFVDSGRPNDASDDSSGLINNLGHGTGTLSILAGAGIQGINGGAPFGCAPYADIVPIRVANSVVLFRNSAIARAFDYVHGLCANPATFVHVVTMSMGGIPSRSWLDAINELYDTGAFVVTAAGNNYANLPTHEVVYPARFARVVAACGVMANQAPYADLKATLMAGNYGPLGKMTTALAAFTPNTPWARFGAPGIVDFDGNGTSAATPQVAAAAALWIQKNRAAYDRYSQGWMRVEAVRKALFEGAHADSDQVHFGRGKLAALDALGKTPAQPNELHELPPDTLSFPFLSLLSAPGMVPPGGPRQAMLELEALQILSSMHFETPIPDTPQGFDPRTAARLADELLSKPVLSQALRHALESGPAPAAAPAGATPKGYQAPGTGVASLHLKMATGPKPPTPIARRLRVYAYDPALSSDLASFDVNDATISVCWEETLQPGPVGEYLEVVDVDPASGSCYAPVDLNHPHMLATDGLAPSEASPQFHQQMCYAVAMRTIEHFEKALGRKAIWASRYIRNAQGKVIDEEYVQRLRIYPHALRTANSFYSPERKALLLGYFSANTDQAGASLPGSRVFCAVSHDVIAHETTHALLDGLHRRFQEATNPDVRAFHEAFADIVALFQHFSLPEALISAVRQTRGDLGKDNQLAKLAVQFGQATSGSYQALRDALGKDAKRTDYNSSQEPHARGSVLVAAVFAAFLSIYRRRAADLIRLATQGTGVLPPGDIPDDLARRLANEASTAASSVLVMCIRALDYCPPVDITFGEYLRALITADYDVVRDDDLGYRVAFISAFRDRGIFPSDVQHLAVDSLLWERPPATLAQDEVKRIMSQLDLSWNMYANRKNAFDASKRNAYRFHEWLVDPARAQFVAVLGFRPAKTDDEIGGIKGEVRPIEVHSVRPARRIGPDGQSRADIVVEITQSFWPAADPKNRSRGGCTLIVDLQTFDLRYLIRKRLDGSSGVSQQSAFRMAMTDEWTLGANFYGSTSGDREPFALLHGRH
jgi:Subtilase family